MKHEKYPPERTHRGRANPRYFVIVLIVAVAIVILAVVLINGHRLTESPSQGGNSALASENARLSTPVGALALPQALADSCRLEDASEGSQYSMRFYGKVGTDSVLLFELSVGENGSGYALGSAPDASGNQMPIWLDIHEIKKDPAWTDDEFNRINELQSYVNDLIEQINHLDGFQGGA